ncbi:MAG TPA: TPM domain-containing protein [Bacteriovoracaceae bacterium]|nr:TPM domain-containing protein [Bacteriovoracaceae bacterium]
MKAIFNQEDLELVEDQIKKFEKATGADLLVVVADSSDPYPAAPWRFGFVFTVLISFVFTYYAEFNHPLLWPLFFMLLMVLGVWLGHFSWAKRLTLAYWEIERECKEKAIELFHSLGTSQVSHQVTAMIMISLYEKEIQVLVDKKLTEKIDQNELNRLIELMKTEFKHGNFAAGLIKSIKALEEKITKDFGGPVCDNSTSELHDTVIFIES